MAPSALNPSPVPVPRVVTANLTKKVCRRPKCHIPGQLRIRMQLAAGLGMLHSFIGRMLLVQILAMVTSETL
ncbi:hypothetical protein CC79DRAFT_981918 [Sarocladium strictum]